MKVLCVIPSDATSRTSSRKLSYPQRNRNCAPDETRHPCSLPKTVSAPNGFRYMGLRVPGPGRSVRIALHPDLPEIVYRRGKSGEIRGQHRVEFRR